ncbi:MAG TPA: hypothetical protein VM370_03165, partial [Candidatus Thermoplasmatota archaeon]|nr:hypothetical protein [Candidatus Thermoplasmatota archaeon]
GVQLLGALDHADLDGALLLRDEPYVGPTPTRGWFETPDAPGLGVLPSGGTPASTDMPERRRNGEGP